MFRYPVTLTRDEVDGGFVVTFVDIPKAITQGDTEAEALAAAKDALESGSLFLVINQAQQERLQVPCQEF